ncbi:MAG: DUF1634 domain-containing protein [Brockia lithotrophica]|nr:DUF1634 domain-containing protein [Brockia lithotrophica]
MWRRPDVRHRFRPRHLFVLGSRGDRRRPVGVGRRCRDGARAHALLGGAHLLRRLRSPPPFPSRQPRRRSRLSDPPRPSRGTCLPRSPGELLGESIRGNPEAIIALGLVLLIASPVIRVAASVFLFLREGDRLYAGITLSVLAGPHSELFPWRGGGVGSEAAGTDRIRRGPLVLRPPGRNPRQKRRTLA